MTQQPCPNFLSSISQEEASGLEPPARKYLPTTIIPAAPALYALAALASPDYFRLPRVWQEPAP